MQFQPPEWHDRLTSTNTVLCDRFLQDNSLPDGFILAAHHQTSGRGRLGRSWKTLDSKNLTFSFLLKSINNFHQITALPMAVAISVASALEYHGLNVQTKWPNDLLIKKRKICGILAERPHPSSIVVGVGVNINMKLEEANSIDQPATSFFIETGRKLSVQSFLEHLLPILGDWIRKWRIDGFSALHGAWLDRCFNLGQQIEIGDGSRRKIGILTGFGSAGQLKLLEDNGQQVEIWSGDLRA